MKKILFLITILSCLTVFTFAQEAVVTNGSNTNISTFGQDMNQYDYLLNPAYMGMLEGGTLFFALDSAGTQFGQPYGIESLRIGWAMNENLGFLIDYQTATNTEFAEVGGEDTADNTADDFQNIALDYGTYDQATGRYATITETVSSSTKNNLISHDLLFHSIFGIGEGMAADAQLLFSLHTFDTQSVAYTNTYSDTAAPSAATLTTKGDRTETVNTLLDDAANNIALDLEFGMNTEELVTQAALGISVKNLRAGNSYTSTVTDYNAGAGVDDTVRDTEIISSNTGQYYYNGSVQPSFSMNTNDPAYLSSIDVGIGSTTELVIEGLNIVVPFDIGFDFPLGSLQTVASTTTVSYNDAAADNGETGRSVNTTTTTFVPGLDMYTKIGGGIKKVFTPAENATVTVVPSLNVSLNIQNDTRSQTASTTTQSDNNGDGDYADAGIDTDTTYTESGYEIQRNKLTTQVELTLPLSVQWKANDLLTFNAGYNMGLRVLLTSLSTLISGDPAYTNQAYTDNLTPANSYVLRPIDGADYTSTPDSSLSVDFSDPFSTSGYFGASLEISDNFMIDLLASGNTVEFDAFTVMGIMKY